MTLGIKIEVITGSPGCTGQPHGINIVRPFFKGLDSQSLVMKGGAEADTERGFSRGFVCSRYKELGHF